MDVHIRWLVVLVLLTSGCGIRRGMGETAWIDRDLRRQSERLRMRPARGHYGPYEGTRPQLRVVERKGSPKVSGQRERDEVDFELRSDDAGTWKVHCQAKRSFESRGIDIEIGPISTSPATDSKVSCQASGRGAWRLEVVGSVEDGMEGTLTAPGDPETDTPGRRVEYEVLVGWGLLNTPVTMISRGDQELAAISHARPFRVHLHPSLDPVERAALTALVFTMGWLPRGR